jgi:hypothetical protein
VNIALKPLLVGTCVVALALGTAACAEARKPDRISLLPTLEAMRPVVACLREAKQSDGKAAEVCASSGDISLTNSTGEPSNLNDHKLRIVVTWMFLDRDPARRMSVADFDQALDFARCIEKAAVSDRDFSSKTERGVAAARVRANVACRGHPLSMMQVSPELATSGKPIENAAQIMLAGSLSGLSLNYALEANGWKTNAMRPCIRYGDGRPPSPGCAGKPEGRPSPPPTLMKR